MLISLSEVSFTYQSRISPKAFSLRDINLEILPGSYTAVVGAAGSGKSTLISLLNATNLPDQGEVWVDGQDTKKIKGQALRRLRQRVGIVWQFPEHQLFANTVKEDIAFGLRNLGLAKVEQERLVTQAMRTVGLDPAIAQTSPFALSGGQQRRVALAGVLAMQPEVLVLDEPTAGLDPAGKRLITTWLKTLNAQGVSIILVTHDLELAAENADRIYVLADGKVWAQGAPQQVFAQGEQLRDIGLGVPLITQICNELAQQGFGISTDVVQLATGAQLLAKLLGRQKDG